MICVSIFCLPEMEYAMNLLYPKYYEDFVCIADRCEDTCCAGWEIDIDDDSYEKYMQVEGTFGERIRNSIKEYQPDAADVYESHGFILKEKRRCPFLNEKNLCDMIIELGEDAICDVCTYTPRNFLEYGNTREISLSPSCAEAGRFIFGSREKVTFVKKEIAESLDFEESAKDLEIAEAIRNARDVSIAILQDREKSIYERICEFLFYAKEVQDLMNEELYTEIATIDMHKIMHSASELICEIQKEKDTLNVADLVSGKGCGKKSAFDYFSKRMDSFRGMESINDEWEETIVLAWKAFGEADGGEKLYEDTLCAYTKYLQGEDREFEYEQLMVYYAFMMLARCVDDNNFWGKAQFAVTSFLMTRDLDISRFLKKNGVFLPEDRVDIARIYAKEVEHSEENIEFLEDEFLFEDIYDLDSLCKQVLFL